MRSPVAAWLVTLPGRLASNVVSGSTFKDCAALTSISGLAQANVTSIGDYAFEESGLVGDFAWPVG